MMSGSDVCWRAMKHSGGRVLESAMDSGELRLPPGGASHRPLHGATALPTPGTLPMPWTEEGPPGFHFCGLPFEWHLRGTSLAAGLARPGSGACSGSELSKGNTWRPGVHAVSEGQESKGACGIGGRRFPGLRGLVDLAVQVDGGNGFCLWSLQRLVTVHF